MKSASGLIYSNGEFAEGSVRLVRGTFKVSESPDGDADATGIILPKTINCHTHVGDAFIEKPACATVEELVAPPNGLKHRMLREVAESVQVESMRQAIQGMASTGTSHFIDFREGGLEGARRLLIASLGSGITPVILGRPESGDEMEMPALLSVADGLGLSAISDIDYDVLQQLAHQARSSDKAFAMHASESRREPIDRILDLKPDLLVHLVKTTADDLEACASAGVPVAVCPTANAYFGLKAPVREMLDAGMTVCLGTDNAMLAGPDILSEARMLRSCFPEEAIPDPDILQMAFGNGGKVLNSLPGFRDGIGWVPDFFVLEVPVDDPFKRVLGARTDDIRLFTRGEMQ